MKKFCNVHIAPTNKETSLVMGQDYKLSYDSFTIGQKTFQHVYVVLFESESQIYPGDWMCQDTGYSIVIQKASFDFNHLPDKVKKTWKKIIATTDETLSLPSISSSYISEIVELHNFSTEYLPQNLNINLTFYWKNIQTINVEFETVNINYDTDFKIEYRTLPKLRNDGSVLISKIRHGFSAEELIDLAANYALEKQDNINWVGNKDLEYFKKDFQVWIKNFQNEKNL